MTPVCGPVCEAVVKHGSLTWLYCCLLAGHAENGEPLHRDPVDCVYWIGEEEHDALNPQ